MFERFTENAREVVRQAQREARELHHESVGTEHLLLALLRLPDDAAAPRAFAALGMSYDDARDRLSALVPEAEPRASGLLPFTPDSKRALEMSLREALARGDSDIRDDHILLAVTRADAGDTAPRLLMDCGITPDQMRDTVEARLLAQPTTDPRSLPGRLVDAARQRAVCAQMPVEVDLSSQAQRLLMSAGARALDDGRRLIEIADIEDALHRRGQAEDPPSQAAAG